MDSITDMLNSISTKMRREWTRLWYPCTDDYETFEKEKHHAYLEKSIKSIKEQEEGLKGSKSPDSQPKSGGWFSSSTESSEKKGSEDPDSQPKSGGWWSSSTESSEKKGSEDPDSQPKLNFWSSSKRTCPSGLPETPVCVKQSRMPKREGILVFTLWYLGIAYNYYMGETKLSAECSSSCGVSEAGDSGDDGDEGGEGGEVPVEEVPVEEVPVEEEPVIEPEEPEPEPPPPPPPPPADEAGGGDVEEEE